MSIAVRENLRQRADYTHKHNVKTGRHGWLRLTPAYSVKVVEELIDHATTGHCGFFDPSVARRQLRSARPITATKA